MNTLEAMEAEVIERAGSAESRARIIKEITSFRPPRPKISLVYPWMPPINGNEPSDSERRAYRQKILRGTNPDFPDLVYLKDRIETTRAVLRDICSFRRPLDGQPRAVVQIAAEMSLSQLKAEFKRRVIQILGPSAYPEPKGH